MLIELSDLSLYLLSYTALDVIHVFLGLLPTIFDRLYLIKGRTVLFAFIIITSIECYTPRHDVLI